MSNTDDNTQKPISCPKCAKGMSRIVLKDVEADRCNSCGGVWLDALELQTVIKDRKAVRELESGGRSPPPQPPADAAVPAGPSTSF